MPERLDHWRNVVAERVCNWVLWHVATPGYRLRIKLFIRVGMWRVYGEQPSREAS